MEYLLRLAGSPRKFSFLQQTMNVIDILAIAPYYISLGKFQDLDLILFMHQMIFFLAFEDVNVSVETGIGDNMTKNVSGLNTDILVNK